MSSQLAVFAGDISCQKVELTTPVPPKNTPQYAKYRPKTLEFKFDRVFDQYSSQAEVLRECTPMLDAVLNGYNATIFAYGQSGSGKTFTMEGLDWSADGDTRAAAMSKAERAAYAGVIPNAIDYVFGAMADSESARDHEFLVRAQYIEIYNDLCYDLLADQPFERTLAVTERADKTGFEVSGATDVVVSSAKELRRLFRRGRAYRRQAATTNNDRSSRSHAIFTVCVESSASLDAAADAGETDVRVGKLNCVDLAGSERLHDKEAEVKPRVRESHTINQSLLSLTRVITALSQQQQQQQQQHGSGGMGTPRESFASTAPLPQRSSRGSGTFTAASGLLSPVAAAPGSVASTPTGGSKHVPYRSSKLTMLLKDALGGTAKTLVIAAVRPEFAFFEQSQNTLRFAAQLATIVNRPRPNTNTREGRLRLMQQQLQLFQRLLERQDVDGLDGAIRVLLASIGVGHAGPRAQPHFHSLAHAHAHAHGHAHGHQTDSDPPSAAASGVLCAHCHSPLGSPLAIASSTVTAAAAAARAPQSQQAQTPRALPDTPSSGGADGAVLATPFGPAHALSVAATGAQLLLRQSASSDDGFRRRLSPSPSPSPPAASAAAVASASATDGGGGGATSPHNQHHHHAASTAASGAGAGSPRPGHRRATSCITAPIDWLTLPGATALSVSGLGELASPLRPLTPRAAALSRAGSARALSGLSGLVLPAIAEAELVSGRPLSRDAVCALAESIKSIQAAIQSPLKVKAAAAAAAAAGLASPLRPSRGSLVNGNVTPTPSPSPPPAGGRVYGGAHAPVASAPDHRSSPPHMFGTPAAALQSPALSAAGGAEARVLFASDGEPDSSDGELADAGAGVDDDDDSQGDDHGDDHGGDDDSDLEFLSERRRRTAAANRAGRSSVRSAAATAVAGASSASQQASARRSGSRSGGLSGPAPGSRLAALTAPRRAPSTTPAPRVPSLASQLFGGRSAGPPGRSPPPAWGGGPGLLRAPRAPVSAMSASAAQRRAPRLAASTPVAAAAAAAGTSASASKATQLARAHGPAARLPSPGARAAPVSAPTPARGRHYLAPATGDRTAASSHAGSRRGSIPDLPAPALAPSDGGSDSGYDDGDGDGAKRGVSVGAGAGGSPRRGRGAWSPQAQSQLQPHLLARAAAAAAAAAPSPSRSPARERGRSPSLSLSAAKSRRGSTASSVGRTASPSPSPSAVGARTRPQLAFGRVVSPTVPRRPPPPPPSLWGRRRRLRRPPRCARKPLRPRRPPVALPPLPLPRARPQTACWPPWAYVRRPFLSAAPSAALWAVRLGARASIKKQQTAAAPVAAPGRRPTLWKCLLPSPSP
jgi:hypothetical protein